MRALVNTPTSDNRLSFRDVPEPEPRDDEALVSVRAVSINRGELTLMRNRPEGWRPGQDVAGVVERPARNGHGPAAAARVAALIEGAGWAERVAVPVERLAVVPDGVDLPRAAGLPMVGLTALGLLRRCGPVIGRRIVVTGASGGVGSVLVQLGSVAGAEITAIARAGHDAWLRELGASHVAPGIGSLDGRFDVILESVGGQSLEDAITHVRPDGRIILFGNSSAAKAAVDMFAFFGAEHAVLETYFSTRAMIPGEIGLNLGYLLGLLAGGRVRLETSVLPWTDAAAAVAQLEARGTRGKIVLATS